jgi:hypothetical protein
MVGPKALLLLPSESTTLTSLVAGELGCVLGEFTCSQAAALLQQAKWYRI